MASKTPTNDPFIRIAPYQYIHVTNLNTHVTRLVLGPQSYVCMQDEKWVIDTCLFLFTLIPRVVVQPAKMISLPPTKYCIVNNPVLRNANGEVIIDKFGQVSLKFGDCEYRFSQKPFPLYPGETLVGDVKDLPVVRANSALRLRAHVNFTSDDDVSYIAGEEWLFKGPGESGHC